MDWNLFVQYLTLCADDFGLSTSVNDAIVALVAAGHLNAVSCMTVGSQLSTGDAERLIQAASQTPQRVQIGLHLTLTQYAPLGAMPTFAPTTSFPTIGNVIASSYRGKVSKGEIEQELMRQLKAFQDVFGQMPDFFDGHQHVHTLPVVREATLGLVQQQSPKSWVRNCGAPVPAIARSRTSVGRALFIAALSRRLASTLRQQGITTNAFFFGVNDFDSRQDFGQTMRRWLAAAKALGSRNRPLQHLIMCHPGLTPGSDEDGIYDPIAARRFDEFTYLSSETFQEDLGAHGFTLKE